VLDVGAGHGRSLGVIAALTPKGYVMGLDNSKVALKIASRAQGALIRDGRVGLEHGRSDMLPFADASFDKTLAVHTLYFWDPAERHLREIARVLRPNGKFVLAFRPAEDQVTTEKFPRDVYTFRTIDQTQVLLADAGFNICRMQQRAKPGDSMVWIVARRKL